MSKKLNKPRDFDTRKYSKFTPPNEIIDTDVSIAVAGSVDAGKCFGKDTKIMLYDGQLKNVQYIQVNDILMGDDSKPRNVLEVHMGEAKLYKIKLSDGTNHIVNGKHLLCLKYCNNNNITNIEIPVDEYINMDKETKKMYKWYRTGVTQFNGSIEERAKRLDYIIENNVVNVYDNIHYYLVIDEHKLSDVCSIIRSLGLSISYNKNNHGDQYMVQFEYHKHNIDVHKQILIDFEIEALGEGTYYGFSTDGNHRFLLDDFSVVHNSSLTGVLFSGELDNGNGSARNYVARHRHEINTGKTSDISSRTMYCGNGKTVTLIDLCGHEKYLKTTLCGITGQFPDYGIIVVASNRGILKMTKEHLGILFYMQIPVIIVITRADMAPIDVYDNTIKSIKNVCKIYNKSFDIVNGLPLSDNDKGELTIELENQCSGISDKLSKTTDYIPIITVSNKTGYYIDALKNILFDLKPRKLWDADNMNNSIFYIDTVFNPAGIGIVLSGILKGKPIKTGDTLLLGPFSKNFIQLRVKSLHNNFRQVINQLNDHQRGCIAISPLNAKQELTRDMITRGMLVISDDDMVKNLCYRFKAEIQILHHSATIGFGYCPVIHSGSIRQSARVVGIENIVQKKTESDIIIVNNPTIKTGDKALIEFKFKYKPEFVETDSTFFFREGTTRGVGIIKSVLTISDDPEAIPDAPKVKRYKKKF